MLGLVSPLCEFFNHFVGESRDVVGFAAGDETVVGDDLLISPLAASVADIGFQ